MTGSTFDTLSDKQWKDLANPLLQPINCKQFDHPDIVAACKAYHETEAFRQNDNMNRVDKVMNRWALSFRLDTVYFNILQLFGICGWNFGHGYEIFRITGKIIVWDVLAGARTYP